MPQRQNRLLVGINYPWIDYGWDFGDPPQAWVAWQNLPAWREQKRNRIVEDFTRFADQGLFAVRWFILPDGTNYGTGVESPENSEGQWRFDPLAPDHPDGGGEIVGGPVMDPDGTIYFATFGVPWPATAEAPVRGRSQGDHRQGPPDPEGDADQGARRG